MLEELEVTPESIKEGFQEEVGLSLDDLFDVLAGPMSLAVYMKESFSDTPHMVIAAKVKPGDKTSAVFRRMREKMVEQWEEKEARVKRDDYLGTEVWQSMSSEDDPNFESDVVCHHEDIVLIANSRPHVEKTLQALLGQQVPSISSAANFASSMRRLGTARDLVFYLDCKQLIDMGAQSDEDMKPVFDALGIGGLRSLWAGAGVTDEGFDVSVQIEAPGDRKGLMTVLAPGPVDVTLPASIPSNALSASVVHLDLKAILGEADSVMKLLTGEEEATMDDMLAQLSEEFGVDLKKDIIEAMLPPMTMYQLPQDEDATEVTDNSVMMMRSTGRAEALRVDPQDAGDHGRTGRDARVPRLQDAHDHDAHRGGGRRGGGGVRRSGRHPLLLHGRRTRSGPGRAASHRQEVDAVARRPRLQEDHGAAAPDDLDDDFTRLAESAEEAIGMLNLLTDAGFTFEDLEIPFLDRIASMDPKLIGRHVHLLGASCATTEDGMRFDMTVTFPPKPKKQ